MESWIWNKWRYLNLVNEIWKSFRFEYFLGNNLLRLIYCMQITYTMIYLMILLSSAEEFFDSTWTLLWYLLDSTVINDWSIWSENNQSRDSLNLKFLCQCWKSCITSGKSEPWHLSIVWLKFLLGLVTWDKDDFKNLSWFIGLFV